MSTTVISKRRSCTVRAETVDKVKEINRRMAVHCDKALDKEADKAERRNRRQSFKNKREKGE